MAWVQNRPVPATWNGSAIAASNIRRAAMAAFHAVAVRHFDEDGIGHSLSNFR